MTLRFLCLVALFSACLIPGHARADSALDRMMAKLGGAVPFPPRKMMETLQAQGAHLFGTAVIPNGRSLERHYTSYESPRTVVAVSLGRSSYVIDDRTQVVFVAYTPQLEQLEIIAASASLPMEFAIVPDYREGNRAARPVRPREGVGLCLACHQNGGPIFPEKDLNRGFFVWSETHGAPEIRGRLEAQKKLDPFAAWILSLDSATLPFVGRFDDAVREVMLAPCTNRPGPCLGEGLASSFLADRHPVGHEYEIAPGIDNDPLIPRLSAGGTDAFAHPDPAWTIPLTRDGTESHPSVAAPKLFQMYCAKCHGGDEPKAPPLPLDDLSAMHDYVGDAERRPVDLLKAKIMPPIGTELPSPEDRQRMIEAIVQTGQVGP